LRTVIPALALVITSAFGVAALFVAPKAFSHVSNVEGIEPIEGWTPKPSASYFGRLRAKVRSNIIFPYALLQTVVGNPVAYVEVTSSPRGIIESIDLVKSSGNSAWDQAVIDALRKIEILPRDETGIIPRKIQFEFRPRD
jgi:colicin import membrane protein